MVPQGRAPQARRSQSRYPARDEAIELRKLAPDRTVVTGGVDFQLVQEVALPPTEPIALYVTSRNPLNVTDARGFYGAGTGQGVISHSRFVATSETLRYFQAKVLAMLNEHMFSVRLRRQGVLWWTRRGWLQKPQA